MAKVWEDKLALIRQYYYEMKNGKQWFFSFVVWEVLLATYKGLVSEVSHLE